MNVIEGLKTDTAAGELTLTCFEALLLSDDLVRAVEEGQDHQHTFEIDIFSMSNSKCKIKLRVDPNKYEVRHESKKIPG